MDLISITVYRQMSLGTLPPTLRKLYKHIPTQMYRIRFCMKKDHGLLSKREMDRFSVWSHLRWRSEQRLIMNWLKNQLHSWSRRMQLANHSFFICHSQWVIHPIFPLNNLQESPALVSTVTNWWRGIITLAKSWMPSKKWILRTILFWFLPQTMVVLDSTWWPMIDWVLVLLTWDRTARFEGI